MRNLIGLYILIKRKDGDTKRNKSNRIKLSFEGYFTSDLGFVCAAV